MEGKIIRIGIVGAGENTRVRHIPGLRAIGGVQIVSVANRSRESSERVAGEFNIPKIYDNWKDLVTAPDTDAIVIGTWPYMHCPATLAALEQNKHVLCEARMAATAEEAHAMLNASRQKPHLIAQIVPAPHTLAVDTTIQRLIAEGVLGEILAVEVRAGGTFLDPEAPLHWRQNPDLSGVNVMSLGIWYESVMRWVGEATRVSAMGKVFVKIRKDDTGHKVPVRIPDHIDVLADFACGAQGHFQISNVTGLAGPSEAFIFGSKGTLRFSEDKLFTASRGDSHFKEITIPEHEKGTWRVEEEFINAIRGKEKITRTSFYNGVKYMEFTHAAVQSMMTGKSIALPLCF